MTRTRQTSRGNIVSLTLMVLVIVPAVVDAQKNPPYTTYERFQDLMAAESTEHTKIIRITEPGTKESPSYAGFFFYQCLQFDPTDRYVLGMRVHCQDRGVRPTDQAEIGFIDLENGYRRAQIGNTTAWNWRWMVSSSPTRRMRRVCEWRRW